MFLPPPFIIDRVGPTAEGRSRLHWTGVVTDTRWKHSPQPSTHDGHPWPSRVWEWAASQVTSWANSAPTMSHTSSHSSKTDPSHRKPGLSLLQKRTTSQDLDTTIGVVVGVLVGVFILGTLAFCLVYRNSIRLKRKKKFRRHHRHKSGSSHGSKSSRSSDSSASSAGGDGGDGGDAEAPAPAPAEGG